MFSQLFSFSPGLQMALSLRLVVGLRRVHAALSWFKLRQREFPHHFFSLLLNLLSSLSFLFLPLLFFLSAALPGLLFLLSNYKIVLEWSQQSTLAVFALSGDQWKDHEKAFSLCLLWSFSVKTATCRGEPGTFWEVLNHWVVKQTNRQSNLYRTVYIQCRYRFIHTYTLRHVYLYYISMYTYLISEYFSCKYENMQKLYDSVS